MKTYNPDVLNCLANLSNDEVFTPPTLANQVLDMLPQELFCSPDTTFLDPVSKSGIFLREIVKRLDRGLQLIIPDRLQRIDHIMHHQVFGIATTELTSYISRRSLYCSRDASGQYSVSHFDSAEGNIIYRNLRHTWQKGKCIYCGARQATYDRKIEEEQYAYPFLHLNLNVLFSNKMQFDVIIGNPPYQLSDGGDAASDAAMPIYQKFIEQAKKLSPRYLTMIVPSKWMVGGRGLQAFRDEMVSDKHISYLCDFEDSFECFPGVHIDGGVCYFLWDSMYSGLTNYSYKPAKGEMLHVRRELKSKFSEIVIRDIRRENILRKTTSDKVFTEVVSARKPFDIGTDLFNNPDVYSEYNLTNINDGNKVKAYGVFGVKGGAKRVEGYIDYSAVNKNVEWISKYKILVPKAYSTGAVIPPKFILSEPGSLCTETFLVVGPFESEHEQLNCFDYMNTTFFRVLLFWGRGTMQVSRDVFRFVPLVDFSHPWTDEMLYKKYGLTEDEIAFIESMIRPME